MVYNYLTKKQAFCTSLDLHYLYFKKKVKISGASDVKKQAFCTSLDLHYLCCRK